MALQKYFLLLLAFYQASCTRNNDSGDSFHLPTFGTNADTSKSSPHDATQYVKEMPKEPQNDYRFSFNQGSPSNSSPGKTLNPINPTQTEEEILLSRRAYWDAMELLKSFPSNQQENHAGNKSLRGSAINIKKELSAEELTKISTILTPLDYSKGSRNFSDMHLENLLPYFESDHFLNLFTTAELENKEKEFKQKLADVLNFLSDQKLSKLANKKACAFANILGNSKKETLRMDVIAYGYRAYVDSDEYQIKCRGNLLAVIDDIIKQRWDTSVREVEAVETRTVNQTENPDTILSWLESPLLYATYPGKMVQAMAVKLIHNGSREQADRLLRLNLIPYETVYEGRAFSFAPGENIKSAIIDSTLLKDSNYRFGFLRLPTQKSSVTYDPATLRKAIEAADFNKVEEYKEHYRMNFIRLMHEALKDNHYNRKTANRNTIAPHLLFQEYLWRFEFYVARPEEILFVCDNIKKYPRKSVYSVLHERKLTQEDIINTMCLDKSISRAAFHLKFITLHKECEPISQESYEALRNSPSFYAYLASQDCGSEFYDSIFNAETSLKGVNNVLSSDFVLLLNSPKFRNYLMKKFPEDVKDIYYKLAVKNEGMQHQMLSAALKFKAQAIREIFEPLRY